jgi:uncharacterized protein
VAASATPVISNTTPLINLVGVKALDLLPALYGEITIPEAVRQEYLAGRAATDPDPSALPWFRIVSSVQIDPRLPLQLGSGEAAALSLAISLNARAVLLDEAYGRRIARQYGLPVVGTLGILLAAKQAALLAAVQPVIDEMIRQGRHISAGLRARVLRAAGE